MCGASFSPCSWQSRRQSPASSGPSFTTTRTCTARPSCSVLTIGVPSPDTARARRTGRRRYQRIAARSITPCSGGAPAPLPFAGSFLVASSVTSNPGSPGTAEVSRQPSR